MVRASSEVVGGPIGEHAAGHPWWTPVRVVLAVACLAFVLGMVHKTPCVASNWSAAIRACSWISARSPKAWRPKP